MKKFLLLLSLITLTACEKPKEQASTAVPSHQMDSSTINSNPPQKKEGNMTVITESIHEILAQNPNTLPLKELKTEKIENLGIFCGNTTPLDLFVSSEATYQTLLAKENADNLFASLSFNSDQELIHLAMTSDTQDEIDQLLTLFEFPDFPERHITQLNDSDDISGFYRKESTYVAFQAQLQPTYDEAGNEVGTTESYQLSYYTKANMKPEYLVSQEVFPGYLDSFKEL